MDSTYINSLLDIYFQDNNPRFELNCKRNELLKVDYSLLKQKSIKNIDELYEKLQNGRFEIYTQYAKFECFFHFRKNSEYLYVIYTGARNVDNNSDYNPSFPRWSYYPILNGSVLCIDDPMYQKYEDLALGWFYGDHTYSLLEESLKIIKKSRKN